MKASLMRGWRTQQQEYAVELEIGSYEGLQSRKSSRTWCCRHLRGQLVRSPRTGVCWWLVTGAGQGSGVPWVLGWQGSAAAAAAMVEAEEM